MTTVNLPKYEWMTSRMNRPDRQMLTRSGRKVEEIGLEKLKTKEFPGRL